MSSLPFILPNLNATNPAAPAGARNVSWQHGTPYTGSDGNTWRDDSANLPEELVLGFVIVAGAGGAGTDVTPMLAAPRAANIAKCKVVVKASDPSTDFVFKIKKNGTDVFSTDPTVPHGTASGTVLTFTALTSSPLAVAADDVFSMDITTGSATWALTIQLET
jgi:hypothetical protein